MRRSLVFALGALVGCNAVLGLHEKQLGTGADADADADASVDGQTPASDGEARDAAGDASSDGPTVTGDGGPSGPCPSGPDGWNDFRSPSCWTTFDLNLASPAGGAPGYEGVAFDGRYVYFAPKPGSIIVRFDTAAPSLGSAGFADAKAWSSFDVKASLGFQPRFSGAVFDGRYVTFVPRDKSPLVVRYDTTASFATAASWSTFDPTTLSPNAVGFAGATFDGRYVYLVPQSQALVLRQDTRAGSYATSWSMFDSSTVYRGVLTAFFGGVYDGRAVYLVPEGDGVVLRFATAQTFAAASSWSKFDTVAVAPNGLTFQGGAFDGRYLYFGPGGSDSVVARHDTQASFVDAGAWSVFDMGKLTPSFGLFSGAAFDGRFVYFLPGGLSNFRVNGLMARYDTAQGFDKEASWQIFDAQKIKAGGFGGAAFDGKYVYFAPDMGTVVARFEARTTSQRLSLPAHFGSFF